MQPGTTTAVIVFLVVAILHALRLVFGWEVTIQGHVVPMWVSIGGVLVPGLLALAVWRESRGA